MLQLPEGLVLDGPDGTVTRVAVDGPLRVDHGLAVRQILLTGHGFAAAHHWLVDDLLHDRRLEVLLPRFTPPSVPLHVLMLPERAVVHRVQVVADALVERLRALDGVE